MLPWESNSVLQPTISAQWSPSRSCLLAVCLLECHASGFLLPQPSDQLLVLRDNMHGTETSQTPTHRNSPSLHALVATFRGLQITCLPVVTSISIFCPGIACESQNLLVLGEIGEKGARERRNNAVYENNSWGVEFFMKGNESVPWVGTKVGSSQSRSVYPIMVISHFRFCH